MADEVGDKKDGKNKDGKKKKKKGDLTPTLDLFAAIHSRRSHKALKTTPVDREVVTVLLEAAVRAPNHKLTEPWTFIVMGPEAKLAYAQTRARRKFKGEDPGKEARMVEELSTVPVVIGVSQRVDEDAERREEDYAATWMAVQNVLLAATAMGLGSKVYTGAMLNDPQLRDALHLADRDRLVTCIHIGQPAEEVPPRKRIPASEKTVWLP